MFRPDLASCSVLLISMSLTGLAAQSSIATTRQRVSSSVAAENSQMFQEAQDAMQRGDLATARPLLLRLHARLPQSFEVNEVLGLLYASENKLTQALPLLQMAAGERPDANVARANLGATLLKMHRASEAARELQLAVHIEPKDATTQENLGQAEMMLHRPAEAAKAFAAALPLDPGNADLLYNDSLALFDSQNYAQARDALSHMPGVELSASAQSLYGDIDEKLGRYKQAAQHDLSAARIEPSEGNIYVLGIELLRHWTFGPAIKEFAAGLTKYPESQRMRVGLGVAYYGDAEYSKAIPVFSDLLNVDPDNALYAEMLGRTCTVLTQGMDPRCSALITFAQKHPQNAMLNTYAAISILHRPQDPQELKIAQGLLLNAVHADPKLPEAHYELGVLLQEMNEWKQSIAPLETAVRLKPTDAAAHYRLSRAYSHVGRQQDAKREAVLNQKYSQQVQKNLDARMQTITTFLVKMQ